MKFIALVALAFFVVLGGWLVYNTIDCYLSGGTPVRAPVGRECVR